MSAARCNVCFVNFPPEMDAVECPVCDIGCLDTVRESEPDEDWQEQANRAEFERYYLRTRGIPHDSDEEPSERGKPASTF